MLQDSLRIERDLARDEDKPRENTCFPREDQEAIETGRQTSGLLWVYNGSIASQTICKDHKRQLVNVFLLLGSSSVCQGVPRYANTAWLAIVKHDETEHEAYRKSREHLWDCARERATDKANHGVQDLERSGSLHNLQRLFQLLPQVLNFVLCNQLDDLKRIMVKIMIGRACMLLPVP